MEPHIINFAELHDKSGSVKIWLNHVGFIKIKLSLLNLNIHITSDVISDKTEFQIQL